MKKNIILVLLLLLATIAGANEKETSIKTVIENLSLAIANEDIAKIENDLSKNFSLSITSMPKAKEYLKNVLNIKRAQSVEFANIIQEGDTTLVNVNVKHSNGASSKNIAAFDKENKLLFFDFFDTHFSPSRYGESKLVGTIPFEVKDKFIFLPIKLNDSDRTFKFLFDTGSDGMAITPQLAKELELEVAKEQSATGIGGSINVKITSNNTVKLADGIELKNQNMAIIPSLGGNIEGIIGLNLSRDYITYIDNEKKEIRLYTLGDYKFENRGEVMDITIPDGTITVPININIVGKKDAPGNFIFDTGAICYLVAYENYVRRNRMLLTGFKPEGTSTPLSGIGGVSSTGYGGKAHSVTIGNKEKIENAPIILQASSNNTSNMPDGSIGIEFCNEHNIVIDMLRKKMQLITIDK